MSNPVGFRHTSLIIENTVNLVQLSVQPLSSWRGRALPHLLCVLCSLPSALPPSPRWRPCGAAKAEYVHPACVLLCAPAPDAQARQESAGSCVRMHAEPTASLKKHQICAAGSVAAGGGQGTRASRSACAGPCARAIRFRAGSFVGVGTPLPTPLGRPGERPPSPWRTSTCGTRRVRARSHRP